MSVFFFDLLINQDVLVQWAYSLILYIPVFFLIGELVSLLVLMTGRGAGIVSQVLFLVSILSGVFFPVEVFPGWLLKLVQYLPTTTIVNQVRGAYSQGLHIGLLEVAMVIAVTLMAYFLKQVLYPFARKIRRSRDHVSMPI